MKAKIIQIGNSKGIRLPKSIIVDYAVTEKADGERYLYYINDDIYHKMIYIF